MGTEKPNRPRDTEEKSDSAENTKITGSKHYASKHPA